MARVNSTNGLGWVCETGRSVTTIQNTEPDFLRSSFHLCCGSFLESNSKARNEMEGGFKERTSKVQIHVVSPQGIIKKWQNEHV